MIDQGIKSRPTYSKLSVDRSGTRHLLLAASPSFTIDASPEEREAIEVWFVASRESEGRSEPTGATRVKSFRSARQLLDRLTRRLAGERMGLRLYATGPEDFLWDVYGVAQHAGLSRHEVRLSHSGTQARRVFCVHCRTFNEGVTTTIVRCDGCGANLFVRDHFSRRLAAFMGVMVDAEVPGDVPPAQQAYL